MTNSVDRVAHNLRSFFKDTKKQILRHSLLSVICISYFIAAIIVKSQFGGNAEYSIKPYLDMALTVVMPIAFAISQIILLFYFIFILRPKSPLRAARDFYKKIVLDHRRYAKAVPVLTIMTFGFAAYGDFKTLIDTINPYSWDVRFMELDRMLHFGQDPWRLLLPLFGSPEATLALNFTYNIWFVIMYSFWVTAGWTRVDHGWERPFLLSFILVWLIGGTILATYWSSMGPVFYDLIDPVSNEFQAQLDHLKKMNESYEIWALTTHETLRDAYLDPDPAKLAGISAMPSMHNATSTLFVFAGFRIWKPLGWAMLAFLICIMIGSVHLAWHYAVDAYAGVIIAIIIWFVSCRLIVWQDRFLEKMGFSGLEN